MDVVSAGEEDEVEVRDNTRSCRSDSEAKHSVLDAEQKPQAEQPSPSSRSFPSQSRSQHQERTSSPREGSPSPTRSMDAPRTPIQDSGMF